MKGWRLPAWAERAGPWLFAGLALLPLLVLRADFGALFWFGDEWDLLDQITRQGFWPWTMRVFAENFVPVFKIAWGGLVLGGRGSYPVMLGMLWLTHACNVALLGRLLRASGMGWLTTALTLVGFGLASQNVETLTWTVQWSAVLSTTFFLGAALVFVRRGPAVAPWSWGVHGRLLALAALSALCFSRGVLTGACLAALGLVPVRGEAPAVLRRLRHAVLCAAPSAAVALLIVRYASGNQHALGDRGVPGAALAFGAWYFALSPLHGLLAVDSWGYRTTLLLGAMKLAAVAYALFRSTRRARSLLLLLLLFDLGNACLLGIGRYHTGLPATVSSRYQYDALLCTLPFVGACLEDLLTRGTGPLPPALRPSLRLALGLALLGAATLRVTWEWRAQADFYAEDRGRSTRRLLADPRAPETGEVPGIPFMATGRARELAARYHLH